MRCGSKSLKTLINVKCHIYLYPTAELEIMKASITLLFFFSLFGVSLGAFRLHFFVNKTLSWQDAQKYCRQNYDDLSTVGSKDLEALSSNPLIKEDYFWIGLQNNRNQWIWSTGEEARVTFWDKGEPTILLGGNCGGVNKNTFKASNIGCNDQLHFYCMFVFELIVIHQESTWEEALLYCPQHYLGLAIIDSKDMMVEAKINSTEADTDDLWIGLRFLAGSWFWVNGKGVDYKAWSSDGELQCPAMNQRCGVYNRAKEVWTPTDCVRRLNFLCVKRKYIN